MEVKIGNDIVRGPLYDGIHNGLEVGQVYERKKGYGWIREIQAFMYVNKNLMVCYKETHHNQDIGREDTTHTYNCSDSALKRWGKLI